MSPDSGVDWARIGAAIDAGQRARDERYRQIMAERDAAIARVWRIAYVQIAAFTVTILAGGFIALDLLVWHITSASQLPR